MLWNLGMRYFRPVFGNDGAVAEQTSADVMRFLELPVPECEHDERHQITTVLLGCSRGYIMGAARFRLAQWEMKES